MGEDKVGEIFRSLTAIQVDLAELRTDIGHYKNGLNEHTCQIKDLTSWRDQMVGRVAIISVLFGFAASVVGALIVNAFRQ